MTVCPAVHHWVLTPCLQCHSHCVGLGGLFVLTGGALGLLDYHMNAVCLPFIPAFHIFWLRASLGQASAVWALLKFVEVGSVGPG